MNYIALGKMADFGERKLPFFRIDGIRRKNLKVKFSLMVRRWRFHHGHGLFLLLAVATGFYMLESSKLGKLSSEILNVDSEKLQVFDLQPSIEMNGEPIVHHPLVVYKNPDIFI